MNGVAEATDLHPEYQHLTLEQALDELERLAPDTRGSRRLSRRLLLPERAARQDGGITGYVDIAELGVADRWCDIAVGAWSVTWNIGPGWEDLFYESYGVQPDPERIEFYRLLYDLAS